MEKLTSSFDFSAAITTQAITFFEGIFNRIAANPRLEKYRKLNWIKVCGRLVNLGLSLDACEHAERMLRDMGFRELADERGHLWLEDASTIASAAQNFQDQVNLHRALFMSRVAAQPGPTSRSATAAAASSSSASTSSSSSSSSSGAKGAVAADLDSASKKRSRASTEPSSESSGSSKRHAVGENTPSKAISTADLDSAPKAISTADLNSTADFTSASKANSKPQVGKGWKIGDRVRVWWCPKMCEGAACFCGEADARQYGATISSVRGAIVEVEYDPTDEWPETMSDEFRADDSKLRKMSAKDETLIGQKSTSSGASSRGHSVTDADKYRENFAHLGAASSSSSSASCARRSVSPVRNVKRRRTPAKGGRGRGPDLKRVLRETGLVRSSSRAQSTSASEANEEHASSTNGVSASAAKTSVAESASSSNRVAVSPAKTPVEELASSNEMTDVPAKTSVAESANSNGVAA